MLSETNIVTMLLSLNAIRIRLNERISMITLGENDAS